MQTIPAEIDEHGNMRLLAKPVGSVKRRAFVTVLEDGDEVVAETALLSEAALAEDWNRPEEDGAWSHLEE
jgi:hypothetical protein